ncbi:unnamed protein product [marine sediment metagenome]|uniref:CinA C-terminal domain-containing protein n=1 Tax=marine sediment metagenome TaxID=412755 RepID=X1B5W9_9ZZZZ
MVDYELLNSLAKDVVSTYSNLGITLGLSESMTGGLIGHTLTNVDGASRVFGGSLVVYTAAAKHMVLDIPMEFIMNEGTVSRKMVEIMLDQMKQYALDVILAITGVAGKEIEGLERGTVFIGTDCLGNVRIEEYHFEGTREEIKMKAAHESLILLMQSVQHLEVRA